MTSFGKWPILERLTNDEFLKLLPHLSVEHNYLTQVFIPKKKWMPMVDVNMQTLQIKCNVCYKQVRFENIKNHLMENEHLNCLRANVKQFYHPFYTYGKGDIKLARGEHASHEFREKALREVNTQMKSFKREYIQAKQFADTVHRRIREIADDQLIQTTLSKNIGNPDDMIVRVSLPFEDIPKLLFCVVSGEWQNVLSYKHLSKKGTFHCNICSLNCSGVESLNSHFSGYTHRLRQLEVLALRYENSSKINKNCCVNFGNTFEFSVKEDAKRQLGNDYNTHITKVSNEISRKIKALDEYVPSADYNSDQSGVMRNSFEHDGPSRFESNEILGHLGVEYVLKIMKNDNDHDPKYECGLCEFLGDGNKMQRHLLYYEHKKKYLDLHYSDTIKKYEFSLGHMCFKEFRAVMSEIVDKVAIEIENHHSRSLPYTVSLNDYKTRRPDLIAEAYALLHASQNRGPSFSNVLSKDDLRNLKNSASKLADSKTYKSIEYIVFTTAPKTKIYLNQMSHDPVIRLREYNAKMNKTRHPRNSRSISPHKNQFNDETRRAHSRNDRSHTHSYDKRSRSRSPVSSKYRSPIRKHRSSITVSNQNIWDIYRREIAIAANEIEIAYENYRKNPESHPLYEEEWNNFWQHRKREIEREGIDHRTYNFQPEWVHYFKQRIEVLFGEALHKSQINIRHRLKIPLDAEEDCQRDRGQSPIQYEVDHQRRDYVATAADNVVEYKRQKRRSSPDYKDSGPQNKKVFPEQLHTERNDEPDPSNLIVTRISDNHSNVVHVLRLMTALEDHLGSLGSKVMDLLSNALQLEKSFPGKSVEFESRVLTVSNCQLLETAMEKLKGLLFAGLLDEKKISGFNRVIQHTENLLKYAEKMGWRQECPKTEKNVLYDEKNSRTIQEHMNVIRHRGSSNMTQMSGGKALSDTLMDLVSTSQMSKPHQFTDSEDLPDCPPPPNIKDTNIESNSFKGYKTAHSNPSGLASFNTKLSLDQSDKTIKLRPNQSLQSEFEQVHRNSSTGEMNLYNNSFKNNNDTRTNANTRTNNGSNVGNAMNYNSGPSSQFRNSQFIPNMGQNKPMFQGEGGGGCANRNQNWGRWNNMN